jgi:hypothetical protein
VPAVIIQLPPDNVKVDPTSGVETVTVPGGSLTNAIDQAIEAATQAGVAEATVEIKVDKPVDAITGESVEVNEVRVEIPVTDLKAVADSEVENVKIATVVGEVTLNTGALQDLITQAAAQGATAVEVSVEHKVETGEDETLTEAQKVVLEEDEKVREIYDVSVLINKARLENFQTQTGKVTISLPYELKAGEVGEKVLTVYIAENGSTEPMTEGRKYDRGMSIFKTSHLSVYAVTYEQEAAAPTPAPTPSSGSGGGGGCNTGYGLIGLFFMGIALRKYRIL